MLFTLDRGSFRRNRGVTRMKWLLFTSIYHFLNTDLCETTRGGIKTAYNVATLQQEIVLSSNMDGMSVGVTTMSLMR